MTVVTSQVGSVGPAVRGFPLSSILPRVAACLVLMLAALAVSPARADVLYRCTGSSGETVFASKTTGYRNCHRVGSFPASRPAKPRPAPPAPPRPPDFGDVRASVVTTGRALQDLALARAIKAREANPFVDVQSSVVTSGRALADLPDQAAPGKAGRWSYRESPQEVASTPVKAAGDQVLRGAVYRVKRADGSVEYTNIRPARTRGHAVTMLFTYIATCMACDLHSPIRWNSVRLNLDAYASAIRQASSEFGVDEAFLRAIIHAESAFNPKALSLKGAQGLMQLMPATAGDMGVRDAFDAEQNIRGGARYLGFLLQTFDGSEKLAAAAYNAGPGAVQRYNGVPPYAETRVYVSRVATLRQRYGKALHSPLASAGAGVASAVQ